MPYIKKELREKFSENLFYDIPFESKGELEYYIFSIMKNYMRNRPSNYTNLHDCVYAAQHCADEFRRRFLDEREDEARLQNGDIE